MLTNNDFLRQVNAGIDITPDEFYPVVRDLVQKGVNEVIKNDVQLRKKLEAYINTMTGLVVDNNFAEAIELNSDFVDKLTGKFYRENPLYINASQAEKDYIDELVSKINEFTVIFKCTDAPQQQPKEEQDRIGYDEEKKENIDIKKEETPFKRTINFNVNN